MVGSLSAGCGCRRRSARSSAPVGVARLGASGSVGGRFSWRAAPRKPLPLHARRARASACRYALAGSYLPTEHHSPRPRLKARGRTSEGTQSKDFPSLTAERKPCAFETPKSAFCIIDPLARSRSLRASIRRLRANFCANFCGFSISAQNFALRLQNEDFAQKSQEPSRYFVCARLAFPLFPIFVCRRNFPLDKSEHIDYNRYAPTGEHFPCATKRLTHPHCSTQKAGLSSLPFVFRGEPVRILHKFADKRTRAGSLSYFRRTLGRFVGASSLRRFAAFRRARCVQSPQQARRLKGQARSLPRCAVRNAVRRLP